MVFKDTKPQFINGYITLSALNTYTELALNLPINPAATVSGGKGNQKVRVMEFLKVFIEMAPDIIAEDALIQFALCYNTHAAMVAPNQTADYIVKAIQDLQIITSGVSCFNLPIVIDLTDGSGNGVLVAVNKIFASAFSVGQGAAMTFGYKILFRYVDIDVSEYVGIVQGQIQ
jgi:hypothetical protein